MYNLQNVIEQKTRQIPVGTQKNVKLKAIKLVQDAKWNALEINFTKNSSEGEFALSGKIFEPNGSLQLPGESKAQALERDIKQFNTKIRDILLAIKVPTEAINNINANSFSELCNQVSAIATPYMYNLVCLKVVANKKNYPSIPTSGKFVLPMDAIESDFEFSFKESEKIKELEEGVSMAEEQLLDY